jgi:precorrin-2 dehydrogenase/sirohydrochlorin ferrochelatase
MKYYPLFLDITRYKCLVLGAGGVARRKIATLLKAHAHEIIVIDPYCTQEVFNKAFWEEYDCEPAVTYLQRDFVSNDLEDIRLAFACTASSEVNGNFVKICEEKNIFCNVIEEPERGHFIVPAHLDYENLVIALSSSGVSPAFTKALKDDLNNWIAKSYVPFLRLIKILRPLILKNVEEHKRPQIFRALVEKSFREEIMAIIELKKFHELHRKLAQVLPESVVSKIDDNEIFKLKKK